jgi:hypothetical protein
MDQDHARRPGGVEGDQRFHGARSASISTDGTESLRWMAFAKLVLPDNDVPDCTITRGVDTWSA